jgi:hypothetical protein
VTSSIGWDVMWRQKSKQGVERKKKVKKSGESFA